MRKIALAVILLIEMGFAGDIKFFKEYLTACNEGDPVTCYNAAKIYSAEAYREKNYDSTAAAARVASLYRKSCDLGYAAGCTAYGMSYAADKNRSSEKDARYYFQKGCDGGDPAGCNILKLAPSER